MGLLLHNGCQMVYFYTKNPNLGKFWRTLEWKMLVYFMTVWNIFTATWCKTVCGHLVYFSCFGTLGPRKIWQPFATKQNEPRPMQTF
jgi:hypothetical protein